MAVERPCKICGARIRVILNEHGHDYAIDAETRMAVVLSDDGGRVRRYQHVHLAHAQTCSGIQGQKTRGGAAAPSKTAPTPSQFKSKANTKQEGP